MIDSNINRAVFIFSYISSDTDIASNIDNVKLTAYTDIWSDITIDSFTEIVSEAANVTMFNVVFSDIDT